MNYIVWLIIFAVFAGLELVSLGMTCIWFACGALAAAITSAFTNDIFIQICVFIVVTAVVLAFLRPLAVKYINNKAEKTNVESLVGKTGKVVAEINNIEAKGMVTIGGVHWTARSKEDTTIAKGALVEIVAIEGVKVIVKEK